MGEPAPRPRTFHRLSRVAFSEPAAITLIYNGTTIFHVAAIATKIIGEGSGLMTVSIFADKNCQPSMDELFGAVGPRRYLWESLSEFVEQGYRAEPSLKFYAGGGGWVVWFRRGGRTIFVLYPRQSGFKAQVILGPSQVAGALALPLGATVRKALEGAHDYPEGRWILADVESEQDAGDIRQLLTLKLGPMKPRKPSPAASR